MHYKTFLQQYASAFVTEINYNPSRIFMSKAKEANLIVEYR